jgi:hypothetical protein
LAASADGDSEAGELFVEYAMAFFGQRQLVWSSGLREKLGLGREKTDTELVEEPTDEATLIAEIPPDDWRRVLQHDAHADVLMAAEKYGAQGVRTVLQSLRGFGVDRALYGIWRN